MSEPTAETISAALRAHQTLALRSENHKAYGALFVDLDELHAFDTPDWQVVYGRRGTGKTFLLRVLEEKLRATIEYSRALPLYVSAHELLASPMGGGGPDADRQRAFAYFQIFLERLVHELAETANYVVGRRGFLETLKRDRQKVAEEVDDIVRNIVSHINAGVPLGAYLTTEYAETAKSTERRHSAIGGALGGTASPRSSDVRVEGKVERRRSRQDEVEGSIRQHGPTVQRLDLIGTHLSDLARVLRLERIVVLLDEWSVIDPTTVTSIQPWFATLLKRSLAGSPLVSVKIATSRYQARFAGRTGEPTGLEIGADLFEAVNLDRATLSQSALEEFYATMLFKRMLLKEPGMAGFALRGGKPSKRFVQAIFRDHRAFEDLVIGSEGNPRNFLATFGSLAHSHKWSVRPRWTRQDVQGAIQEQTLAGLEPVGVASDAGRLLEACVEQVVRRKGSRDFVLRRTDAEAWGRVLEELLERRLLHERPTRAAARGRRAEFRAYQLAYGLWLDVERTSEVGEGRTEDGGQRGDEDELVVDLRGLRPDDEQTSGNERAAST